MVMAARAANRHTQKGAARRAHHVLQLVSSLGCRQYRIRALDLVPRAAHQKPRRRIFTEQIAGELLDDEAVIWLVLVKGINDIIAITPGVRARLVHLKAMRFGEAHHVQPMARPPFAILRGGQQAFDDFLVSIGGRVPLESQHVRRRRWQSDEVEVEPANQRAARRFRGRSQFCLRKFREDKVIDRIARLPLCARYGRDLWTRDGLQRPMHFISSLFSNLGRDISAFSLGRQHMGSEE